MRGRRPASLIAVVVLVTLAGGASAAGLQTGPRSRMLPPQRSVSSAREGAVARADTMWIFEADFEDTLGDNAGWTVYDRSGTLGQENQWHIDTIRIPDSLPYLGDHAWWCGTDSPCWRQPRGYGNNWYQLLSRNLPEIAGVATGDTLILSFDQRFAMERLYDYGYVEVSDDGGQTWNLLETFNNSGYLGAGKPEFWDGRRQGKGHVEYDLSAYAGDALDLRFRFESDDAYSPEDEYDNAQHSVRDGAWEIDDIKFEVNPNSDQTVVFYDGSEAGDTGWTHDDVPARGQTGVTFWRGRYGYDFVTGRPFMCEDRPYGSWMYAPISRITGKMVDNEHAWLMSPPIWVSGAEKLIGVWDLWVDMPEPTNDQLDLLLASSNTKECVTDPASFIDEQPGWWFGGPFWDVWGDNWDAFAGNDWLAIMWLVLNAAPAGVEHMAGVYINRQKVGIPSGGPETVFEPDIWHSFNDWFREDLAAARQDTALIKIQDEDGIESVHLVARNPGQDWSYYECQRDGPESDWFLTPPPLDQFPEDETSPGRVIYYYYEVTDSTGSVATYPDDAPDEVSEMTILPLKATTTNPGILIVDKHGWLSSGRERNYRHTTEYYYREMLEILGYEYEVYDVEVPSGDRMSEGPDTSGMKYYDTQIWIFGDWDAYIMWPSDIENLKLWLSEAAQGADRNLLVTGNNVGYNIAGVQNDSLGFYRNWLACDFIRRSLNPNYLTTVRDTIPGLVERAGGDTFLVDGPPGRKDPKDCDARGRGDQCIIPATCPDWIELFDVVDQTAAAGDANQVVADYIDDDSALFPAGVAYTDPTSGYQTVTLGFGMEFMMAGTVGAGADNYEWNSDMTEWGYYHTGICWRCVLMSWIMDYFGKEPEGAEVGIADGGFTNELKHAYPNPFNPVTTIAYSVKDAGPVTIRVYNAAGRLVRTLLDAELEAGSAGHVVWDGTNDEGKRCASGVYFYRIAAPGFTASRKMVILK